MSRNFNTEASKIKSKNKKHVKNRSTTFVTWRSMVDRCYNPNLSNYKWYGAKGVTICKRWHKFDNFIKDMGERPANKTIDRIDNTKSYSPGNCRWSDFFEQNNNTSRNRKITYNEKTLTVTQWAREIGINIFTFRSRVYHKWPPEKLMKK